MSMKPVGFTARDLMQAIVDSAPQDDFVNPDASGKWWWRASGLSFCHRKLILERMGLATDARPLKGELTMMLGTILHREVERGMQYLAAKTPGVRVVEQEVRHHHPTLPLAGKPDGLLYIENVGYVIYDFKTEHELAAKRRSAEARENEADSSIRPEHALQLGAGALLLEADGIGPVIQGHAIYMSKNNMWTEMPGVDLEDTVVRREVVATVESLEAAWAKVQESFHERVPLVLPRRLPEGSWQCRPQKDSNYGEYCPCRAACMDKRMPA